MTLIHADGFDAIQTVTERYSINSVAGSGCTIQAGRISGNCIRSYSGFGSGFRWYVPLSNSYDTLYVGFAIQVELFGNGHTYPIIAFSNALGEQVKLVCNGGLIVFRNDTLLDSSVAGLTKDNWHYLEIKVTTSNSISADDFIIRVDGEEVLNLNAGTDTQHQSTSGITRIDFAGPSNSAGYAYIDDLYVCSDSGSNNNTFLGDVRITPVFPNAVGTNSDFTPSDGTSDNYEMVDDATNDGDTTYVESETVDHYDTYQCEAVPATPYEIKGIAVWGSMTKDDAGNRTLKAVTVSDGTTAESPETIYPTAGQYLGEFGIFEEDPATGAAWTESAANAAEFGFKIES